MVSALPFTRATLEKTITDRFLEVVAHASGRVALTGAGRSWSYARLNEQAGRLACAIHARTPPGPGCVAMLVEQAPEMVIATLAVLKAGKAYLGIHPGQPVSAQSDLLRQAAPELLVASPALAGRARAIAANACPVLDLGNLDERLPAADPPVTIRPGDPSTLFFTSGTTGQPKGVVKCHRAVLHRVWLTTQYEAVQPDDRQSLLTHCAFASSEADLFGALLQGATLCVFDAAAHGLAGLAEWIDREGITLLHPPVLLFRSLLASLEGSHRLPSVRLVTLAGDSVLPGDLERWRRHFPPPCELLHRYSTSETALLTVARFNRTWIPGAGSLPIGHPVADKTVTLVDEAGRPVPPGEAGEIEVRSRYLADGYWRQPGPTAAAFSGPPGGERVYRTGDLARFLPDGSLSFVARREHLAKIRGFRVDAREVEFELARIEGVVAASVIVRRDQGQDSLWAFVVTPAGASLDPESLGRQLRERLPEWKIPARFESLPSLPSTLNGKVDRQRLAEVAAYLDHPPTGTVEATPATTLEEQLARLWKETLRLDRVTPDCHFLALGGHSIAAMILLNRIERAYGIRLGLAAFFEHATLRGLASLLRQALESARSEVGVPRRPPVLSGRKSRGNHGSAPAPR